MPETSLFAHIKYGSRRVRPKIRHLALLDGCACTFEEWVYGGWKVPYLMRWLNSSLKRCIQQRKISRAAYNNKIYSFCGYGFLKKDLFADKGWYIYIESSSPQKPNDKARVISAAIPARQQVCVKFWYNMYGDHVNKLNLYLKVGFSLRVFFFFGPKMSGTMFCRDNDCSLNLQEGLGKIIFLCFIFKVLPCAEIVERQRQQKKFFNTFNSKGTVFVHF